MIMPEKLSLSDFVSRRLHPVKVTLQLLNHELEQHSNGGSTQINADLLGSAINTVELFVEDYEKLIEKSNTSKTQPAVERKFVGEETKPSAQ